MALTISRLTREYVFTDISSENDLAAASAELAFKPAGELPLEEDWEEATIEANGSDWKVSLLVGDGTTVTLAAPDTYPYDWQVWLRITDNPERPVRRPGIITVE